MKSTPVAAIVLVTAGLIVGMAVNGRPGQVHGSGSEPADARHEAAPEFSDVADWINSKPLKLAEQRGKVVVVHFWTNGCINCIHNYPHYRAWEAKYKKEKNFLMIGIHTPEFDAEKDIDQIKDRMATNKLTFAVAVDNRGTNWKAWNNRYWPCVYLVDKKGAVRQRWEGELGERGYDKLTRDIDALLGE